MPVNPQLKVAPMQVSSDQETLERIFFCPFLYDFVVLSLSIHVAKVSSGHGELCDVELFFAKFTARGIVSGFLLGHDAARLSGNFNY